MEWRYNQETVYCSAAADTFGSVGKYHRNWFDENEGDIQRLINKLHRAHKNHLDDKTSIKKKQDFQQTR